MTKTSMAVSELAEKGANADVLREMIRGGHPNSPTCQRISSGIRARQTPTFERTNVRSTNWYPPFSTR